MVLRFPRFLALARRDDPRRGSEAQRFADTQLEMGAALIFGLQRKNLKLRFVEHCTRVAALVEQMAEMLRLGEGERNDLRAAAQLHEIGMIAVPTELIEKPSRLDEVTIARIRQQAGIGAEMVRVNCGARVAQLVETQYADFAAVRTRFSPESVDTLLAGLLRAADVLDTMQHPRPYQADLDPTLGSIVLHAGEGTRFHPLAVKSLEQLRLIAG